MSSDRRAQDEVFGNDQADSLAVYALMSAGSGMASSFISTVKPWPQHEVRLAGRLAAELLRWKDAAAYVAEAELEQHLGGG